MIPLTAPPAVFGDNILGSRAFRARSSFSANVDSGGATCEAPRPIGKEWCD